jgi:ABC-2 type transport system permease protein
MQRLLGRYYKWWYVFYYSYQVANTSFGLKVFIQISIITQALIILWVWHLGNAAIGIFTYLIVGRIYKSLSDVYIFDSISSQISSGSITKDLLVPMSYFKLHFFRSLGFRVVENLISAAGMVIAGLISVLTFARIELNWSNLILVIIFLPLSFLLQYLIGLCVGFMTFFARDKRNYMGINRVYNTIFLVIFVGTILPLDKFPSILARLAESLPFAYFLHFPMQIYLGKYDFNQTLMVFAGGITWYVVLYFLAKWVFKMGLKRNEAVGL